MTLHIKVVGQIKKDLLSSLLMQTADFVFRNEVDEFEVKNVLRLIYDHESSTGPRLTITFCRLREDINSSVIIMLDNITTFLLEK